MFPLLKTKQEGEEFRGSISVQCDRLINCRENDADALYYCRLMQRCRYKFLEFTFLRFSDYAVGVGHNNQSYS